MTLEVVLVMLGFVTGFACAWRIFVENRPRGGSDE